MDAASAPSDFDKAKRDLDSSSWEIYGLDVAENGFEDWRYVNSYIWEDEARHYFQEYEKENPEKLFAFVEVTRRTKAVSSLTPQSDNAERSESSPKS